ncbi:MAG: segregation/condensation protein A [Atopobiaceae bacterium]|nr:segregation/condensation protein A [Atopobiaceae bacterium]
MSYRVRTQAFSGPFDLLLSLVSRQRVDIGTISISEVADQYLAEVDRMQDMDLDVASDFLLVASTLLDIKAASLVESEERVPDSAFDDEGLLDLTPEEARDVLVARLATYKKFRNAASMLGARMESESRMHPRTAGPDPECVGLMPNFLAGITLRSLSVICADLLGRAHELFLEAEHVAPRRFPVRLAVESVIRTLRSRGKAGFSELVGDQTTPEAVVVTFLALLELYKHGAVSLTQDEEYGEIDVEFISEPEDRTAFGEFDGEDEEE